MSDVVYAAIGRTAAIILSEQTLVIRPAPGGWQNLLVSPAAHQIPLLEITSLTSQPAEPHVPGSIRIIHQDYETGEATVATEHTVTFDLEHALRFERLTQAIEATLLRARLRHAAINAHQPSEWNDLETLQDLCDRGLITREEQAMYQRWIGKNRWNPD